MKRERVLVMGAAGRDFHNFNVCFRNNPSVRVVAFTAAQIPFIASRRYPASLAGPLYPRGIPVYDEALLPELIVRYKVNRVVFAYSDISHKELMHRASLVLALGADFSLLGPTATMVKSSKPVISVCAVRTGCGKSQVTRYLCQIIRERGLVPVVIRHPMPYGDLARQEVERFGSLDDLALYRCSIEEREEYEPLLRRDVVVYAGVDYVKILHLAEREADVLLWDGGNNDFPFYVPNLEITIVDPLRSGDETEYYPGEVNLRRADVVLINKSNTVAPMVSDRLAHEITTVNATARIIKTDSVVSVADSAAVAGKNVLVVEDGPSVTHGGLNSGAGHAAAVQFQAGEIVDPRPFAFGSLVETYRAYPHIGPVLPAMGYSARQVADLRKTIEQTPCDLVIAATPIDLGRLMPLSKPLLAVTYDIREVTGEPLQKIILQFLAETSH